MPPVTVAAAIERVSFARENRVENRGKTGVEALIRMNNLLAHIFTSSEGARITDAITIVRNRRIEVNSTAGFRRAEIPRGLSPRG